MWTARHTRFTVEDQPGTEQPSRTTRSLWIEFLGVGLCVCAGGWAVARATESFVVRGGLEASVAGALLMGVVNAVPEAVTSIAAVRRGALTLAMAGVLGGNAFESALVLALYALTAIVVVLPD